MFRGTKWPKLSVYLSQGSETILVELRTSKPSASVRKVEFKGLCVIAARHQTGPEGPGAGTDERLGRADNSVRAKLRYNHVS